VHRWPVPDFGWRDSLGGQERGEASACFATLVVGTGHVDVQAASPFRGGDVGDADVLGMAIAVPLSPRTCAMLTL
jgi:hypothetical protein